MRLTPFASVLLLLAMAPAPHAGPLEWFAKAGRTAGKTVPKAARVAPLTRAQALAFASALGAGTLYVEVRGGRVALEAMGAGMSAMEGRLDDLVLLTTRARALTPDRRPRYMLSADGAAELESRLDILLDSGTVYVPEPSMSASLPLARHVVAGKTRYFKELRHNVLVPLKAQISPEVALTLSEPLRRESISVVPIFASSDVDSLHRLAVAAGDSMEDAQVLLQGVRSGSLGRLRSRTVIVVGHIEDGAFVARGAGGQTVHSLAIDTLEQVATVSDAKVLSAGCFSSCAGAQAGFIDAVSDLDMAEAVKAAFDAETNADLLKAFAMKRPLIVSEEALDRFATSRSLHLAQMAEGAGPVRAGAVSLRLATKVLKPPALWGAVELLGGMYVWGLIAVALMFRSSRAGFLHVFPKLPSPHLPETRFGFVVARGARELLFMALAPLFAVMTVFTFLFGGWPYRQTIMVELWTFLRHPIRQTLMLVFIVVGTVMIVAAYVIGLGLLLVTAGMLIDRALESGGAGPLVILAGYVPLAVWGGWKAHRAVQSWLDRRSGATR